MQTLDDDVEYADEQQRNSRPVRVLWILVYLLAAAVLLGVVTLASVALLSPDAWVGPCKRPELVRPGQCTGIGRFSG
jgi:hypothetical protein